MLDPFLNQFVDTQILKCGYELNYNQLIVAESWKILYSAGQKR